MSSGLPSYRSHDEKIPLLIESMLIAVKPHRYPHFWKGEIDKHIKELVNMGIKWPTTSPYSSPVFLAKKK